MKNLITVVLISLFIPIKSLSQSSEGTIYECRGKTEEVQGGIIAQEGKKGKPNASVLPINIKFRYELSYIDSTIYLDVESSNSVFTRYSGTYRFIKKPYMYQEDGYDKVVYQVIPTNGLEDETTSVLIIFEATKIVFFAEDKKNGLDYKSIEIHTPIIKQWAFPFSKEEAYKLKAELDLAKSNNEDIEEEFPCVYDVETQTDDFLKGIDYFKGYVWNIESKSATIRMSENEELIIHKGGCDHYSVSATVKIKRPRVINSLEYYLFYVLMIAEKLPQDFMHDEVLDALADSKYSIETYENGTEEIIFNNDIRLIDLGFWIRKEVIDYNVIISFGWSMY